MPVLAALLAEAPIATSPLNYRLRARLHWDPETRRLGFYETRSQRVTSIDSCTILSPELMSAIPSISDVLAGRCPHRVDVEWLQSLEPGDAIAGLRAARGGPVQLDPSWIPDRENLGAAVSGFHSLDRSGEIHAGWGATAVTMDLPTPLRVPIGAFFQGNRHLIRALYQRIADLAGSGPEPIYDLHAGVGFLAAAALANGEREAHLVEPHRIAARAAALNLPAASVAVGQTAENYVGSAADLPGEALVITDPPRSGLTRPLRESLVRWQPRRVLMLGCDPATWARDAGHLVAAGYQVRSIELFDLFPSTHHVEILALLERT